VFRKPFGRGCSLRAEPLRDEGGCYEYSDGNPGHGRYGPAQVWEWALITFCILRRLAAALALFHFPFGDWASSRTRFVPRQLPSRMILSSRIVGHQQPAAPRSGWPLAS